MPQDSVRLIRLRSSRAFAIDSFQFVPVGGDVTVPCTRRISHHYPVLSIQPSKRARRFTTFAIIGLAARKVNTFFGIFFTDYDKQSFLFRNISRFDFSNINRRVRYSFGRDESRPCGGATFSRNSRLLRQWDTRVVVSNLFAFPGEVFIPELQPVGVLNGDHLRLCGKPQNLLTVHRKRLPFR